MIYEIEVIQFLPLYEGNSKHNPTGLFVNQTLVITEIAKNYRQWFSASNFLHFAQSAVCHKSIINLTVIDFLEIHDGGHKSVGQQDLVQYLIIGQYARTVEYEIITDTLVLIQSVDVVKCQAAFQTLILTQTAEVICIRNLSVDQVIVIYSGGVGYIEDKDRYNITLPTLTGPNAPECH